MDRFREKYIKPASVAWWASVVPIVVGIIIAADPLHGWHAITLFLNAVTGDAPPAVLINAGIAGIGLRGAMSPPLT